MRMTDYTGCQSSLSTKMKSFFDFKVGRRIYAAVVILKLVFSPVILPDLYGIMVHIKARDCNNLPRFITYFNMLHQELL